MAQTRRLDTSSSKAKRMPSPERREKAFLREAQDPVGLLRNLRRLISLQDRDIHPDEWKAIHLDLLIRCHAIDPSWESLSDDEIREMVDDPSDQLNARGVKQLGLVELEPEDQLLASRMGEIRGALHKIHRSSDLSAEWAKRLTGIADDYQAMLADSSVPLAPQEQRIWDLLIGQPEDRPLQTNVILARLRTSGGTISETNAKKSLRGNLKRKGVRNRKRAGYFIPVEFRPEGVAKK